MAKPICSYCGNELKKERIIIRIPKGHDILVIYPKYGHLIKDNRKKRNGHYPFYFHAECLFKLDISEQENIVKLQNGFELILGGN